MKANGNYSNRVCGAYENGKDGGGGGGVRRATTEFLPSSAGPPPLTRYPDHASCMKGEEEKVSMRRLLLSLSSVRPRTIDNSL